MTGDDIPAEHPPESATSWAHRAARLAQRAIWARRGDGYTEPDLEVARTMALISLALSQAQLVESAQIREPAKPADG
jgi:hypothetical protein